MKLILTRTVGVTRKLVYEVCENMRIIDRNVFSRHGLPARENTAKMAVPRWVQAGEGP